MASDPVASSEPAPSVGGNTAHESNTTATEDRAAAIIQRTYRGHKARRQLNGLSLDPGSRWDELLKEAQYRNLIRPRSKREKSDSGATFAHQEWQKLAKIARRAGNDDTSETEGEETFTEEQREAYLKKKAEEKRKREAESKMMGLEYFLEMVDTKHRYGSHLRSYHAVWKQADTNENFFYWLDFGDGKNVEVPQCSREKLERDQVRYLSREERYKYLIKIDPQGRLIYAKNGERVTTSWDYRDSLEGIVPRNDSTPSYREDTHGSHGATGGSGSDSSGSESDSSVKDGQHYVNQELHDAKGVRKVQYISAGALVNHLLQNTTKKNTWIFVADTSFRLYIGIKQSGAFQHSSFLQGARISAAGTLKVKDGYIRRLDPLSGHYRPPTKNFRSFVRSLKERGADMSHVSISKSYAVLLGVEGYMKSKKRAKSGMHKMELQAEKVFRPEDAKKREEAARDKSESARKEKEYLERKAKEEREARSLRRQFSDKLKFDGARFSPPHSPRSKPGTPRGGTETNPITPPPSGEAQSNVSGRTQAQ